VNTYLSSAQQATKDQYVAFANDVVKPMAGQLAAHEVCLKEFLQTKLGPKGYAGITVPREYGGQGGSFLDVAMLVEAIGQHEPGLGLALGNHYAVTEVLLKYGTDTQKSRYLPLLARGEGIATLAFSEPNAGTDFEAVQSTVSNGQLNGTKTMVVTGDFATLMLVLSKNGEELALHLVDVTKDNVTISGERKLMGLRSNYINDIEFKNFKLNGENEIKGKPAREIALYAMDVAKVVLAAAALGLLENGLMTAVKHAQTRTQFGSNIGQFQGVQWKIADMAVETTGSRLQTYRAAWSHDEKFEEFSKCAAMSKWFVARSARMHSGEAMEIMASAGLEADSLLERFYRDAKTIEIVQGTAEFQKLLLINELDI
jgi:alkylation response protein AidB-like acyl-CoA dehydrogenase